MIISFKFLDNNRERSYRKGFIHQFLSKGTVIAIAKGLYSFEETNIIIIEGKSTIDVIVAFILKNANWWWNPYTFEFSHLDLIALIIEQPNQH